MAMNQFFDDDLQEIYNFEIPALFNNNSLIA